jgi:hypothetical protein
MEFGGQFAMTILVQKKRRYLIAFLFRTPIVNFYFLENQVICRMLNLNGPAQPAKSGSFGPGKGPIWLDELGCSGTENTLMECARLPWAKHNCRHTEDAGVRCSHPTNNERVCSLSNLI